MIDVPAHATPELSSAENERKCDDDEADAKQLVKHDQEMIDAANAQYDFHIFSKPLNPAQIIAALRAIWEPVSHD